LQNSPSADLKGRLSRLAVWSRLVRLPAVFTVIAQLIAAFVLGGGSTQSLARLLVILLSGVALYWSGMIFNDLWDVEEDRLERPSRPLPSGELTLKAASHAAWGLMIAGVLLAALSGWVPGTKSLPTFCPAIIALLLSTCILLYNGPFKQTPFAPFTMGICRLLCFLLGAAPLVVVDQSIITSPESWFAPHVLCAACGIGIYIMGITIISRSETVGGNSIELAVGVMVMVMGAVCLALVPRFTPDGWEWQVSPGDRFPLLIGLIGFTVFIRGIRVVLRPEVPAIQNLVRVGILTLIPLSAALAMLAGGPAWGLITLSLAVPAIVSALRVRVT
jgi:4-hydroxybenzoate polyprenyltransferase